MTSISPSLQKADESQTPKSEDFGHGRGKGGVQGRTGAGQSPTAGACAGQGCLLQRPDSTAWTAPPAGPTGPTHSPPDRPPRTVLSAGQEFTYHPGSSTRQGELFGPPYLPGSRGGGMVRVREVPLGRLWGLGQDLGPGDWEGWGRSQGPAPEPVSRTRRRPSGRSGSRPSVSGNSPASGAHDSAPPTSLR